MHMNHLTLQIGKLVNIATKRHHMNYKIIAIRFFFGTLLQSQLLVKFFND
jgi:hypothetical protein